MMSKKDRGGPDNGVDHIAPIHLWDFSFESDTVDIKVESKNVRAFLGEKYKQNPEINFWVVKYFSGQGKVHLIDDLEHHLTPRNVMAHGGNKPAKAISTPPGSFVLRISEFICSKKIYERVFHQAIISMREEYFEALAEGKKRKALWIKVRGYLWLVWTVVFQLSVLAVSGPIKIIKSLKG